MFLDIALGMIAAVGVSMGFGMEPELAFIALGAVFALLPDVDFWVMLARRGLKRDKRFDHEHRILLHKPLIFIGIGAIIIYFATSPPVTLLFVVGALIHFLHDSTGAGWGIRWFHPFSHQYIGICHDGLRQICGKKWIQSVSEEIITRHCYATMKDDHDWIKDLYLRPSKTLIIEISVLLIAIGAGVWYFV